MLPPRLHHVRVLADNVFNRIFASHPSLALLLVDTYTHWPLRISIKSRVDCLLHSARAVLFGAMTLAYKVEELLALRDSVSESAVSIDKFADEDVIKGEYWCHDCSLIARHPFSPASPVYICTLDTTSPLFFPPSPL